MQQRATSIEKIVVEIQFFVLLCHGPLHGGFHILVELAQQLFSAAMAMFEEAVEHLAYCEAIGQVPKGLEWEFVFDRVDEQGAVLAGRLRLPSLHPVALTPVKEGSFHLAVAEPLVPVEVLDERDPGHTDGGEPGGAKAQRQAGTATCRNYPLPRRAAIARRWVQLDLIDTSLLPLGMELWQVRRVGKKGEHGLNGMRQPLSCAKTMSHLSLKLLVNGYRTEILN